MKDRIDELWDKMKLFAIEKDMIIKQQGDKEIIIDKINKSFYMKCRARDVRMEKVLI